MNKSAEAKMKIGELSRISGLSAHTLRYYEKNGLLKATGRSDSNYRIYSKDGVGTASFIKRARAIGFSLEEVATFLSIRSDRPAHVCADAKNLAEQKIVEVENKIVELKQVLLALHRLSEACCGGDESAEYCSIIDALDQGVDTILTGEKA
jgi:MerR family transcriptional regulator, Zn(II)-responsive regulator of zntA